MEQVVAQLKEIANKGGANAEQLINALKMLATEKEAAEKRVSDEEFDFYSDSKGFQELTVLLGASKTVSSEELINAGKTTNSDVISESNSGESSGSSGVDPTKLAEAVGESEIRVGEPAKENEAPKPKSEGEDKKAAEEKVTEENEQEMEY